MRPEPALQSPAIARKKLVRPELGLPWISTRSPGPTSKRGGASAIAAVPRLDPDRVEDEAVLRVARSLDQAGAGLDRVEIESAARKFITRSSVARQSAIAPVLSTNQRSDAAPG